MAKPPYKGGPPWGGQDPPPFYNPPPPPRTDPPRTPPYVGNVGNFSDTSASTSQTFPVNANAGDGVVIFVFGATNCGTVSAKDSAGSTWYTYPGTFTTSPIYVLWCPLLRGSGPSVTVSSTNNVVKIYGWLQIVGGNPQFFIDGINVINLTAASVSPFVRTTSPADLIVAGATNNTANGPYTFPGGYSSLKIQDGPQSMELDVAWTTATQPIGTSGTVCTGSGGSTVRSGASVAIRTLPYYPQVIGPPRPLPLRPPWMPVISPPPFPGAPPAAGALSQIFGSALASAPALATGLPLSGIAGLAVATGSALTAASGAGVLAGLATAQAPAVGAIKGAGVLAGVAEAIAPAKANLTASAPAFGLAFAVGPVLGSLTGSAPGFGRAFAVGPADGVLTGSAALKGTATSTGFVYSAVLGAGQLAGSAFGVGPAAGRISVASSGSITALAFGGGFAEAAMTGSAAMAGRTSATGFASASFLGAIPLSGIGFASGPVLGALTALAAGAGAGILLGAGYVLGTISFTQVAPTQPPAAGGGPGKLRKRRDRGPYMREGQVFGEEYRVSPQAGPKQVLRDEKGRFVKGLRVKMEMMPQEGENAPAWVIYLDTTFTDLDD